MKALIILGICVLVASTSAANVQYYFQSTQTSYVNLWIDLEFDLCTVKNGGKICINSAPAAPKSFTLSGSTSNYDMDLEISNYNTTTGVATVVKSEELINYITDEKPTEITIVSADTTKIASSSKIPWAPSVTDAKISAPYMVIPYSKDGTYTSGTLYAYYTGDANDASTVTLEAEVSGTEVALSNEIGCTTNEQASSCHYGSLNITASWASKLAKLSPKNYTAGGPSVTVTSGDEGRVAPFTGQLDVFLVDESALTAYVEPISTNILIVSREDQVVAVNVSSADKNTYPTPDNAMVGASINGINSSQLVAYDDPVDVSSLLTIDAAMYESPIYPYVAVYDRTQDDDEVWLYELGSSLVHENDMITILAVYQNTSESVVDVDISVHSPTSQDGKPCSLEMTVKAPATQPALDLTCTVSYMDAKSKMTTMSITNITYNAVDGYNQTEINNVVYTANDKTKGVSLESVTCDLSAKKNVYTWFSKSLHGYEFPFYENNPLSDLPNKTITGYLKNSTLRMSADPVIGCNGTEYYPMVEAMCKNGKSVAVYGDGISWTVSMSNEADTTLYTAKTNLTADVITTCGGASILPATLMVALLSVVSIFK